MKRFQRSTREARIAGTETWIRVSRDGADWTTSRPPIGRSRSRMLTNPVPGFFLTDNWSAGYSERQGSKPIHANVKCRARKRMPFVTIKTGWSMPDGEEEVLREYLCDWPGCPNVAVYPLGCIRELRAVVVVCEEHSRPAKGQSNHQQDPP